MAQPAQKRSVGRPREFDEERALEAAMDEFWKKGYESTSLNDLCCCTGLHKGSLYQAFGDKHKLFMRSLNHYADREFKDVAAVAFQQDSPLDSIRALVRTVCDHAAEGRGCLMINSMVELAPHDPEVKEMLMNEGQRRIQVMTELLTKAQEAGEVRPELDPARLAQQLMVGLAGAAALVKGLITTEEVMHLLESMIDLWT
ncbi:MAG: TetR/AcrR family transcriptional regulator [Gammaproteobacteria bacterium]|jgi:TetR/AcrR family transcriptional repressor of nem operon|nr:TetR/AcrR family transcriptional regulator [Gammaproteobacteria bacterium]MDH3864696.1 TetR/AcrR family transcriptional regulator [Gammaproteobacteria bacterium]MDH3906199.1 TetR/AcrR family transcriptional regulator [Gammaproteobacteria bacterium]MDH4005510.1 TetR/AcrR family transcriptional regulator [Gammaproteobacteria bacterium]